MEGRERKKRGGGGDLECEGEVACNTMGNCDKSPGENQPLLQYGHVSARHLWENVENIKPTCSFRTLREYSSL